MSGGRSVSPRYGYDKLRALEGLINARPNQRLIFANSPNAADAALASAILNEAERRTGLPTNAVTARNPRTGAMVVVFRNRNVTRAEVLEELRHLDQPRLGLWDAEVPGFSSFQIRELDVAAHFRNLLRQGTITAAEFDETIQNLARHLNTTRVEALRILDELSQP